MPIKSYLLFPHIGKSSMLQKSLSTRKGCDVYPADNKDVLVLVTDTSSEQEDEALFLALQLEEGLHHINLISGFTTEPYEKGSL